MPGIYKKVELVGTSPVSFAEAVKAAVEAGTEAAKQVGEVISTQVIPRPHEDLVQLGKWIAPSA